MKEWLDWLDTVPLPVSVDGFMIACCLATMWLTAEACFKPADPSIRPMAQAVFLSSIVLLLINVWLWIAPS